MKALLADLPIAKANLIDIDFMGLNLTEALLSSLRHHRRPTGAFEPSASRRLAAPDAAADAAEWSKTVIVAD